MAEDQNEYGERWNQQLNRFLEVVLGWKQLGTSRNDVYCDDLRRKVGIDSVYAYKRNPHSNQQVVIVEAKTAERQGSISKSKVQTWLYELSDKVACAPHSTDFERKYSPEASADYRLGLIALWIRDSTTYQPKDLQTWLSQLEMPQRRPSVNIGFISNDIITKFCAIEAIVKAYRASNNYQDLRLYRPDLGTQPAADGSCFPVETLLSKFVFFKARKTQRPKGRDGDGDLYETSLIFYLGSITSYQDLRFIALAMKQFQLTQCAEVEIFTTYDPHKWRNQIETFKSEFQNTKPTFIFNSLSVNNDLPGWLQRYD